MASMRKGSPVGEVPAGSSYSTTTHRTRCWKTKTRLFQKGPVPYMDRQGSHAGCHTARLRRRQLKNPESAREASRRPLSGVWPAIRGARRAAWCQPSKTASPREPHAEHRSAAPRGVAAVRLPREMAVPAPMRRALRGLASSSVARASGRWARPREVPERMLRAHAAHRVQAAVMQRLDLTVLREKAQKHGLQLVPLAAAD